MKHAPIIAFVDVERSFSMYNKLSDNRLSFTTGNLTYVNYMVVNSFFI